MISDHFIFPIGTNRCVDRVTMAESFVYVQSKEHRWVPARVVEKVGDEQIVVEVPIYSGEHQIACDGGENARFTETHHIKLTDYPNNVLPLQNVDDEGKLVEVEDMVNLSYLHEVSRPCLNEKVDHCRFLS